MKTSVYFDYAAATPVDPMVAQAMQPFLSEQFFNPSALYQAARDMRKTLEVARGDVAQVLGARSSEIIFTAGGTESDNLAISGVMRKHSDGNVVVSAIEHDAVLNVADQYDCRHAPVNQEGLIDIDALIKTIDDDTVLVSVMYANNEIGTVQPIARLSKALQTVRDQRRKNGNQRPLYFHTDACQAANYLDLHVARLGVDLMTLNGGKIYGPKSGVLYVRGGIVLEPLVYGGGQERGLRSGTENVASCVGFAAALTVAQSNRHDETKRLQDLQKQFIERLASKLPSAILRGSRKLRLPNNIHLTIPGTDNERLLVQLDEAGVQAAAGSACSASSDTPSHVLQAIGLTDSDAQSSLRFSMGRNTTAEQVNYVVDTLAELVA